MIRFLAGVAVGAAVTLVAMVVVALDAHDEAARDSQVPRGYASGGVVRPGMRVVPGEFRC